MCTFKVQCALFKCKCVLLRCVFHFIGVVVCFTLLGCSFYFQGVVCTFGMQWRYSLNRKDAVCTFKEKFSLARCGLHFQDMFLTFKVQCALLRYSSHFWGVVLLLRWDLHFWKEEAFCGAVCTAEMLFVLRCDVHFQGEHLHITVCSQNLEVYSFIYCPLCALEC
jgi:hypothetical protein